MGSFRWTVSLAWPAGGNYMKLLVIYGGRADFIRWVYIIEGLFSVVCALAVWFGLPNDPTTAWFLNEEEREMMRTRNLQRKKYLGSCQYATNSHSIY